MLIQVLICLLSIAKKTPSYGNCENILRQLAAYQVLFIERIGRE